MKISYTLLVLLRRYLFIREPRYQKNNYWYGSCSCSNLISIPKFRLLEGINLLYSINTFSINLSESLDII